MVSSYIKTLLVNNKRVILPEFGGFVVKRSASGDIISFNNFLKFNDDILVEAIMKGESLSKEQATKKINEFVVHLTNELENKGEFEIDKIGFLMKDKKGNIRFVTRNENSNKDFSENTQRQEAAVTNEDEANETITELDSNNTISEQDSNATDDKTNNRPPVATHTTTNSKDNKKKEIIIICAVIAAIICIAIVGWIFKDNILGKAEKAEVAIEKPAPVAKPQPKVYAMQPLQVDTISGILVVADKNIATKGKERYNVIVGSFSDTHNAQKLNMSLINYGLDSEIFDRYNGFQAVSYGKYPSVDIALRIAGEQLIQVPDVWILVK